MLLIYWKVTLLKLGDWQNNYNIPKIRNQIRKEILEEIDEQKQSVLEDPQLRGQILELEVLRNHRVMLRDKKDGSQQNDGQKPLVTLQHIQQQELNRELDRKNAQYNKYRQVGFHFHAQIKHWIEYRKFKVLK